MKLKRLLINSILTAIALSIFVLEAQIPPLLPIPGIKLGLSNIVTLFALVFLTPKDALLILVARIILGSFIVGNPIMLIYSLIGGLCCLAIEVLLFKLSKNSPIWGASAIGALIHNTSQIIVASIITNTTAVFLYLPALSIAGIITGIFTGLCVWYLVSRYQKQLSKHCKY